MKISRQTREIINMVIFVLVAALLIVTYVVYPLNRTKAIMGRYNLDDYNEDSLAVNDPAVWTEAGLAADSFMVESDGLTTLACLYVAPDSTTCDSIIGTVFLLHEDGSNRDSLMTIAEQLVAIGYSVVAYDQRTSGRSTGRYHGDGQYEATDLEEIIRYLDMREKIHHPLAVVGFDLGADAALLTAHEDQRIDRVIAVNPYLTTDRMLGILRQQHDSCWFPFYRTMMWWWYELRSGYAAPYRELESIEGVACRTLLLTTSDAMDDPEVERLRELSDADMLRLETVPTDNSELMYQIRSFIAGTD